MPKLNHKKLIRLALCWLVLIPSIPFIFTSLGLFAYAYWPRNYSSVSQLTIAKNTEYMTLSAHGVNDSPASWSDELQHIVALEPYIQLSNVPQQNYSLNWEKYSNNVFICSVAGKKIGIEIGKNLAIKPNLKAIHAIGHSCGSFVALGICEGAKSVNPNIVVQTTYLDPVSVYSGIFWNYGIDHFGTCADFSDNYIDTRDTVPGSNQSLPYAYTFDVTHQQTEENAQYPPHAWPTRFYINAYRTKQVPLLYKAKSPLIERYKKGDMTLY